MVLEIDEDELVLIIFGRPFLTTARAVIDVHEGKLSLRLGSKTVTFNIGKSMKSEHSCDDYLYYADHTAKLAQEQWIDTVKHDGKWTEEEEEEDSNEVLAVSFYPRTEPVEPLKWKAVENRLKSSNGVLGYFQIPISPEDQEKITFTCPYGTFAYKRMPFGLCNAPSTFQSCMTTIFHDLIEDIIYEETKLVLNWEKRHFMAKEGIVLVHKVLGFRIEVDKAKIKAISKVPYPTNVKAIRSFLGHTGFYRRFIKDFSQIARPMTPLLVKDAPFNFFEECIQAFDKLKNELTQALIMIKPDWSLPFEIMCNASDYAVETIWRTSWNRHHHKKSLRGRVLLATYLSRCTENHFLQINELDETRLDAYETSISCKERTKRWHDKRIKALTNYEKGDKLLKLMMLKRPKENTKCVSAAGEELTAAKHKLELKLFRDAAAAHMK
nr:reverse transcriptase domain-containing protein [Tanacetum cinerariifolium]